MRIYFKSEVKKCLYNPKNVFFVTLTTLIPYLILTIFFSTVFERFNIWHMQNQEKSFYDFLVLGISFNLNIISIIYIVILTNIIWYTDIQSKFIDKLKYITIDSVKYILSKLIIFALIFFIIFLVTNVFLRYKILIIKDFISLKMHAEYLVTYINSVFIYTIMASSIFILLSIFIVLLRFNCLLATIILIILAGIFSKTIIFPFYPLRTINLFEITLFDYTKSFFWLSLLIIIFVFIFNKKFKKLG